MPIDIGWALTGSWWAGDFTCRAMMVARAFGLYLSSFVVICIAIDRYYTVLKPLNVSWEARLRYVLGGAWAGAALASLPECIIYHIETYPVSEDHSVKECTKLGVWSKSQMFAYFIFDLTLLYLLPLLVTVYCSCAVIREIIKRSNPANDAMRRSGVGVLGRARARTLKMSITIVAVFIICWTPYYFIRIRHQMDKESRPEMNPMLLTALWMFTYTNSCANPIVYGIFNRRRKNNAATSQQCILAISEGSRQPADRGSEAV